MTVSNEDLMAYADGALDGADRARVEAAVAADPALAAVVENHRALRAKLSAAYAPVLDEAVPARLTAAARGAADNVVAFGAAKAKRPLMSWGVRELGAMAAALLVGVIVGGQALRPSNDVVAAHGALEARGGLARALDTQLAADAGAVRIGVTFRTADGGTCRTFAADAGALSGLACREEGKWLVDTAMRGQVRPSTEFRTAAAETPPEVLARVDALIVGDPLDAPQEKAARDARWAP